MHESSIIPESRDDAGIITVSASKTYNMIVKRGCLADAGGLIARVHKPCKALIVTDDAVAPLYAGTVEASLREAGFTPSRYVFPHGERSKNFTTLVDILETLASRQFTRADLIIALGGGVTGDMAGFAAAVYLRGIPFVQIPTTFLAAIDSSVGGKTAVDLDAGKNLAGAFYQPELVICDYDTLKTLPGRELSAGAAEAVKYGVLADEALFDALLAPDWKEDLAWIILRCVAIKRDLVMADEFDTGARQLLNLGHTLAHAVEKRSGYEIPHGEAVAVGLAAVARAAARSGMCAEDCPQRIVQALRRFSLPTDCPYPLGELVPIIQNDKKRAGGTITVVIPERIGRCRLHKMPLSGIEDFFARGL